MSDPLDDHWACACVKRTPGGQLRAIKLNPPSVKKCTACGAVPLTDAVRVPTRVATKCPDCGRHHDKRACPFCAALRNR